MIVYAVITIVMPLNLKSVSLEFILHCSDLSRLWVVYTKVNTPFEPSLKQWKKKKKKKKRFILSVFWIEISKLTYV